MELRLAKMDRLTMEYDEKVFIQQFPLVKYFVYHLTYYWELHREYLKLSSKPLRSIIALREKEQLDHFHFWKFTIDGHLLQATNYWCMVFGARGSNPTHWRNLALSEDDAGALRESFRGAVLNRTGFTESEWDKYWEGIVDFRNKYAVHRDNFKGVVPYFKKALEVAYAYDTWVREIISPDSFDEEPPLKKTVAELKDSIGPLIKELLRREDL